MILRQLLPWRTFVIDTSWSPEVAGTELGKVIEKPRLFGGIGDSPFVGEAVNGTEFVFRRRFSGRNSFLPRIRATVEPSHHGGARIRVRMRVHFVVIAIVIAFLGAASTRDVRDAVPAWIVVPLLCVALMRLGFAPEARKAEELLRAIYARAPALPPPPDTGQAYR